MSDQEAVGCILKAIDLFRNGENDHFKPQHPDYERTVLEGWLAGAISLRIVTIRLGISGHEALGRLQKLGIEAPYSADREIERLATLPGRRLRSSRGG